VGRKRGCGGATREVNGARVAGYLVAVRIDRDHGDGSRVPAARLVRPPDAEAAGGGRGDRGADRSVGERRVVPDRDRLIAGRLQGDAEGVRAVVGGGEGVVRGQVRLVVAAGEVDRAGVVGVGVAGEVERRDGDRPGHAGRGGRGADGHLQLLPRRGVDRHVRGAVVLETGDVRVAIAVEVAHRYGVNGIGN